jgi:hypothetical protein
MYGPNFTKLIKKFIVRGAVPPGAGIATALEFFTDPDKRKMVLDQAEMKAIEAVQLIHSAPDNPYGDDIEAIAGALVEKIEERQAQQKIPY